MLRVLALGALVGVAGCNAVFGLDPVAGADGGAADGSADAGLGPWGAPAPIPALATAIDEEDPAMTAAGDELYFTTISAAGITGLDLMVSRRASPTAEWPPPQPVTALNSIVDDASVRLTADGRTIYVASNRPGGAGNFDVWRATRADASQPWSAPVHVTTTGLNSAGSDRTASPCLGDTRAVFASDRDATLPDLYELTDVGANPIPGASAAGTNEGAPFVSEDCLTLYFTSSETGALDLYVMGRTALDAPWSAPQPIAELNTAGLEADPWVSPDQRTIVFSYDPTGTGAFDLYTATR